MRVMGFLFHMLPVIPMRVIVFLWRHSHHIVTTEKAGVPLRNPGFENAERTRFELVVQS